MPALARRRKRDAERKTAVTRVIVEAREIDAVLATSTVIDSSAQVVT